jgi:colanic acid biosynthesis glycosyl transferase WcaI
VHILILNEYYPPDTSATAYMAETVAKALAEHHKVTVIAGRPSYDPLETYPYRLLRKEIRDGINVERVGSTAYPRHKMRRRVANYLSFLALVVPRAVMVRSDAIVAMTDPPIMGIAAAVVSRLTGRPLIYNIRDMYPDMAVGGEIVKAGKFINFWERLHRWALRRAKRVIVLGDDMRDRIVAKGVPEKRVIVIRDGTQIPEKLADQRSPVAQEIRSGFAFVAVHAGNLGFYGAWGTLLQAAARVAGEGIGLVFVGGGANRDKVAAQASGIGSVRFVPFRPANEIPDVMAAGDVHVVTIKRGLEGVVVPSKLFGILAAGRPVLVVAPRESDAARIVTAAKCGIAVDPEEPDAVADALRTLASNPDDLSAMGARARKAAENYVRVNELSRFVRTVEEAVAR